MPLALPARSSALATVAFLVIVAARPALADELADIKKKDEITIGVKAEYKPFGFRDTSGQLMGFEIDIANAIAKALGVKAKFEPVQDATRLPYITQSRVDLVIATMNTTPERERTVGMIQPFYYASGASVVAPKSAHLKSWEDLRGKKVCATQGANWNKPVEEKYAPTIVAFRGMAEAQTALQNGECTAFLYGNTSIAGMLNDSAHWADYEAPLPTLNEGPWAMAVKLDEKDKPLGKELSALIVGWHKDGWFLELEKKWHLPASPWLAAEHEKYKNK